MIIYTDENFPPDVAEGMAIFQRGDITESVEVRHVKTHFYEGIEDTDWLPVAGKEKTTVVTQDRNIRRTQAEWEICRHYEMVVVFIKPPSKAGLRYWQMVELIVKHWQEIKNCGRKQRPAAYRITLKSRHPELLPG